MSRGFWNRTATATIFAGMVAAISLWVWGATAAEERAAIADLRKVAFRAKVWAPLRLRVKERFDDMRDHHLAKAWNFYSPEPVVADGLRTTEPSEIDFGLDQEMLRKQFPERRIENVLYKRWTVLKTSYELITARDGETWYTYFSADESVP